MIFRTLLVFVALTVAQASAHDVDVGRMLRKADHEHRELFFGTEWSWSNILFHAHICPPGPACHHHPLCGCPDCHKPHPPGWQSCDTSSDSSSAAAADGDAVTESQEYESEGTEDSGETYTESNNDTPESQGRWYFSPLAYILMASAFVGIVGAMLYKRRKSATEAEAEGMESALNRDVGLDGMDGSAGGSDVGSMFEVMSSKIGMIVGGAAMMGAAGVAAGVAAVSGRSSKPPSESSTGSKSLSGSVAARIQELESGDGSVTPYIEESSPDFVEVPDAHDSASVCPSVAESASGIEVEGPWRPSSQYSRK